MSGGAEARRRRVLFLTTELGGGGAEMQLVRVANHLDRARWEPSAAVLRGGGAYEAALAADVPLHLLAGRGAAAPARALRALVRRERPDLVCSFLDLPNFLAWAACRGLPGAPRLVACVQAPPTIVWSGGGLKRRAARWALARMYARAERIVAISEGVAGDVAGMAPAARRRTEVVFNAGVDERVVAGAAEPLDAGDLRPAGPLVVGCGRLVEQKGFPYLLRAFARLRERVPDATLWIVGEGPDRPALEAEAAALGLGASARLLGFRANPYRYMAAADVFALSSIFEGFGNVIVEAMACGTAVVSTDCPHGPSEIITHGADGLLVPPRDEAALAGALARVLEDGGLRARLAAAGRARAGDFGAAAIARRYEAVFDRTLAAGPDAPGGSRRAMRAAPGEA